MDLREFLEYKMSITEGDITTSIVESWVQRYKDIENTKATVFTDISNFNKWKEGKGIGGVVPKDIELQKEFLAGELYNNEHLVHFIDWVKPKDYIKLKNDSEINRLVRATTQLHNIRYAWIQKHDGEKVRVAEEGVDEIFHHH